MLQFYKPNPRVTGSACSFWYNYRDKAFFSCIIKQDGWDAASKTGSFSKNKDNPEAKVVIKLSPLEIASIVDGLEANREAKGYHDTPTGTNVTTFNFGPYLRDGNQVGFSYSATKTDKKDTTKKSNYIIGFNFGEGRLLRQHLMFLLDEHFKELNKFQSEQSNVRADAPTAENPAPHPADLLEL